MNKPKYPVVLVHGMMAKDFSFWPAFRGITDFLEKHGLSVYVTNQDGIGAIDTNALQLKSEIEAILQKEHCEKVNIIAHSKGGLDARYMISCLGMADRVASLTTLSTPHHGSGLSTHLLQMPRFFAKTLAFSNDTLFRLLGDRQPNMMQLGRDLTAESMDRFNEIVVNAPSVYYQSFSSATTSKKAFLRFIPYQISRYCEQDDTDGMVSVNSSRWGNYQGSIDGDINHFKMVGIYGSKKKLADVGLFYLHIIEGLQSLGF